MSGKVYSKWIDVRQSTDFTSDLMGSGFGRLQIDIDLFEDNSGETPTTGATGNAVFTAQTTSNPNSTASINNSTVDVSVEDYDRPFAVGRVERIKADLSDLSSVKWVRIDIWRGL